MNEQELASALYKKLLGLYPPGFKERLGESMEQTFADLCNEKRQSKKGLVGFMLWMFIETAMGIIQERVLSIKEINPMKNILTNLRSPALISLLLVLTFMVMGILDNRSMALFYWCSKLRLKTFYYGFPVNEKTTVRALYKKLLALYPREFKERLGESMEQTFNDLYQERQTKGGGFGLMLWMFAETAVGVLREQVLLIAERDTMKTMISNPRLAPVISFILCVLPFMILEWATRSNAPRSDASPMLWVVLWLLSTGFIVVLMLLVRNARRARAGNRILANPFSLLLSAIFLAVFAWQWLALVIDQMPCFLGGSGC